jgi:hypothetical protein
MYTPDKDGYVKFGMYKEMRDERTLLFDAIKISDGLNGKSLDEWQKIKINCQTFQNLYIRDLQLSHQQINSFFNLAEPR